MAATFGWLIRLALAASRLKRAIASGSCDHSRVHHLHRALAAHLHVLGQIHLAHAAFAELAQDVIAVGDDRTHEVCSLPAHAQRRAVARAEALVESYSVPHCGQIFSVDSHALHAQGLVAHQQALAGLLAPSLRARPSRRRCGCRSSSTMNSRSSAPQLRVLAAHGLVVRKNPVARVAADQHIVRPGARGAGVARAAVGAELREHGARRRRGVNEPRRRVWSASGGCGPGYPRRRKRISCDP